MKNVICAHTHIQGTMPRNKGKLTQLIHKKLKHRLSPEGKEKIVFLFHFLHTSRPSPMDVLALCLRFKSSRGYSEGEHDWLLLCLQKSQLFYYKLYHIRHIIFRSKTFPGFLQNKVSTLQFRSEHMLHWHTHPQLSPDLPPHNPLQPTAILPHLCVFISIKHYLSFKIHLKFHLLYESLQDQTNLG